MKLRLIFLFTLLLLAGNAFSQVSFQTTTLAFPQIALGGDPAGQNYTTLVQLLNNNSVVVTGQIRLLGDSGSALSASFDGQPAQSTMTVSLAPGEFRQIQMTMDGAVTAGWLAIAFTPSEVLASAILQFKSGSTLLSEVGVDAAFSTILGTDFAIDVDSALNTGIALANPSTTPGYALARLWDPGTGALAGSSVIPLPANGHVARFISEIFPTSFGLGATKAKVSIDSCSSSSCGFSGGNGFLATAIRLNSDQFTTIPVSERSSTGEQIRILPQIAFGGPSAALNMKTVLYLTTNVTTGVFGTAEMFDNDGNPLNASVDGAASVSTFTFTVPGARVTRLVLTGDATLRSGWIRLTLSGPAHLVANAVFQTYTGTNLTSEASVLDTVPATHGLIPIRTQQNTNVGVALANSQSTANTITLTLYDIEGNAVGTRDVTLAPNGHLAQFVTELFPQLNGASIFDGSLSLRSDTAFSPLALRLSSGKVATLPVAEDGMHRPSLTSLRVTRTVRAPATVDFSVDIADLDGDLATAANSNVTVAANIDFGTAVGSGLLTLNGGSLVGAKSGTLTGTFQPTNVTGTVPAGLSAALYIQLYDAQGNVSDIIAVPFKF